MSEPCPAIDELDRRIIEATQTGLPLVPRPYHAIAERLGIAPELVMTRMQAMLASGVIRRMGVIPNHYALGYRANAMTVWDVDDHCVDDLGAAVGALDCVSHCYRRPRHRPHWPYNLFAMVHGHTRGDVEAHIERVAAVLGDAVGARDVLYSRRLLKKAGLRIDTGQSKRSSPVSQ